MNIAKLQSLIPTLERISKKDKQKIVDMIEESYQDGYINRSENGPSNAEIEEISEGHEENLINDLSKVVELIVKAVDNSPALRDKFVDEFNYAFNGKMEVR